MEYLDKFYDTINEFLIKLGYINNIIDIYAGEKIIILDGLFNYNESNYIHGNLPLLEEELSKIDNNLKIIKIKIIKIKRHNAIDIFYSSDKLFNHRELDELSLYYFINKGFEYYDFVRLVKIESNLINYYPFEKFSSIRIIQKYQREVIKNLTNKQLSFYLKLMNDIKSKKVSNQQDIIILKTSGFIFYKGNDDKVKTLIFNER